MLMEEYGIPVVVIHDMTPYTSIGINRELKEWKAYLISTGQPVPKAGIR